MRSNFVFQEIWVGLRRNLTMTAALIVVVAISLSLLGTGLLFVKQVDNTRTYWQSKVEISVYLCYADSANPNCHGPVTQTQTTALEQRLQSMPQVQNVTYVSQAQAWVLYKQAFTNAQSYVSTLKETDMPPSLEIKLRNPSADYNIVSSAVTGAQGVDSVIDEMNILDKFYRLLDGLRNAVVIVALILVVAAVLLVANTIRLSAFNRRRETGIMRRRRVQLLHPAAVPARGRNRRPARLGARGRPAHRGEVAAAQQPAAVLQLQRGPLGRRPGRGHHPRDGH